MFGSTDENPQKLENLIEVFRNKGIDGLIIVPCEGADEIIRNVALQNIPVVLLDREVPDTELSSVVLNNRRAGVETTQALIRQGFTRIEMISYSMNLSNIREREEGYRFCMTEAGLNGRINIHHLRHDKLGKIDEIVRDAKMRNVEAFVFATNTLAANGLTAIFRNGWRVPQDFAMACFERSFRHLQNGRRLRAAADRAVRHGSPRPADQEYRTERPADQQHPHRTDARNRRERHTRPGNGNFATYRGIISSFR